MKKILYFIPIFALSLFASAQNLSLSYAGGAISNNGHIYLYADSGYYNVLESHLFVMNNSASSIDVKVKKTEISTVNGSENSFCWGMCYTPSVFVSPDPITISAGVMDDHSFIGDYKPKGHLGETVILYTFYNILNTNDSVSVNVHYTATPVSVPVFVATSTLSNAFPNPASSKVSFNYDIKVNNSESYIIIKDITGTEVKREVLNSTSGRLTIGIEDLSEGVYFYSLIVDGKALTTKKLIIQN